MSVPDRTRRLPGVALLVWATLTAGVAHTAALGGATALASAPPEVPAAEPSDDLTWGIRPVASDDSAEAIARPAFSYELAPGAVVEDAVRITNFSEVPLTLRVGAHDAFNTDSGGFDVLPAGTESVDVGSWVTLATDQVTIPAREHVDVPFRTSVPSNASPGDHAGGIVASMTVEQVRTDGTAVAVDNRVGARIYIRVAGPVRPALVVAELETRFEPEGLLGLGGAAVTTYTIRNTGNVRLSADQRLEISGVLGLSDHAADPEAVPELLPGGEYTNTVTVDGVRATIRLSSELTLSPSDPELAPVVATTTTWAVPWRALALVAAVVVGLVWFRRRRAVTTEPEPGDRDDAPRVRDVEPAS